MFTYLRCGTHPNTAARLRRLIVALAVVTGGVLGWAGAVPAASASIIPVPGDGPYGPVPAPQSGDRSRRHARLADHPNRGRRRPGRGRRRGGPGPCAGQPPDRLCHRITSPARARHPPGPDHDHRRAGRTSRAGTRRA